LYYLKQIYFSYYYLLKINYYFDFSIFYKNYLFFHIYFLHYFRYVKLLVNHPRKVITIVVLLCSSTILIPYFIGRLPEFSHPELVSTYLKI